MLKFSSFKPTLNFNKPCKRNRSKLSQENVSEANSQPVWWFISHLAPLWSYFFGKNHKQW